MAVAPLNDWSLHSSLVTFSLCCSANVSIFVIGSFRHVELCRFGESVLEGCPSNCPSKTRRIARLKATKHGELQRKRNGLVGDFQFRNQQVAGSIPAGGSILFSSLERFKVGFNDQPFSGPLNSSMFLCRRYLR